MWFSAETLYVWGGNYGPKTINGEWWRLLSNIFLHGGLLHLVFNSIVLANIGVYLEPFLGSVRLLIVYLITGVSASMTSVLLNDPIVSVGASGAIFGLYGFFLALLTTPLFRPQIRTTFLRNTLGFVGINIAFGFIVPAVDNAAHLGGLLSGGLLGYLSYPLLRKRKV
ncbi:rhomboid family intramembrane serine protease [Gynuella sp.]|uniref:rhomboid family intramembrane serine protease n=1 Tax=Gynuella sp. TaxID=2969146 RepID=UPI003D143C06